MSIGTSSLIRREGFAPEVCSGYIRIEKCRTVVHLRTLRCRKTVSWDFSFLLSKSKTVEHGKSSVDMDNSTASPWLYEDPVRFQPYWFEHIDLQETRVWVKEKHSLITFLCAVYIGFIWAGPIYMKNRAAFDLKKPLVLWNLLLAAFSILCTIRSVPEFLYILSLPNGFHRLACVREGLNPPAAFWGWMFTVSKIFELGDTVFIILRKKNLQLLHWYHHCTVLYFCFFMFIEAEPMARWAVMNVIIHSFMYTYFALMAMNIRIPKKVSIAITSMQILQFIIGLYVNIYTMTVISQGYPCVRSRASIKIQVIIGFSYLFLFMNFFYKSYVAPKPAILAKKQL